VGAPPDDDDDDDGLMMALRYSVCLSVVSRSSVETDQRIELIFGSGTFFDLPYAALQRIRVPPKIRELWNLVSNSGLWTISTRYIDHHNVLPT